MTVHDPLVVRSVRTLLILATISTTTEIVVPALWPHLPTGVSFLVLIGAAFAMSRAGWARAAAWGLVGLGTPLLALRMVQTGGPESRFVPFLPLAALVAVSWLGRRAGYGAAALLCLTLVAGWALALPTTDVASDFELFMAHASAVILGAAFLAGVVSDLRVAAEVAWQRALEAEQAAAVAHAADEARDRFLATVSHELRTPLDTILGYAELLREEEDDPDRGRDLDRIRSAGRQLQALVDDVLDMSRVEADELRLVVGSVDLGAMVDQVVHTTAPQVAARQNRLRLEVADGLPPIVSDPARIRQILLNLVSNAAKYTTDGEIVLGITATGDEVRLAVRDTGIGIPEDQLPRLFAPFVQLHEGPDRRPGIGLGLALSQGLAARLGGRIDAESRVGGGSTFTLVLPVGAVR